MGQILCLPQLPRTPTMHNSHASHLTNLSYPTYLTYSAKNQVAIATRPILKKTPITRRSAYRLILKKTHIYHCPISVMEELAAKPGWKAISISKWGPQSTIMYLIVAAVALATLVQLNPNYDYILAKIYISPFNSHYTCAFMGTLFWFIMNSGVWVIILGPANPIIKTGLAVTILADLSLLVWHMVSLRLICIRSRVLVLWRDHSFLFAQTSKQVHPRRGLMAVVASRCRRSYLVLLLAIYSARFSKSRYELVACQPVVR